MITIFQCDKCGACCRSIAGIGILQELDRGDGVCKYLQNNLCTIYANRPLACRVDECYKAFFKDKMSKEEFYRLNHLACEELKKIK